MPFLSGFVLAVLMSLLNSVLQYVWDVGAIIPSMEEEAEGVKSL